MPRKRLGAEQIIPKLREAEVDLAKGLTVGQVGVLDSNAIQALNSAQLDALSVSQLQAIKPASSSATMSVSCWPSRPRVSAPSG